MRTFDTGATRSNDSGKIDPEGFLSPLVLERYCQYLHKHRVQEDGGLRDSDNWQKGMPLDAYMKSAWRHFFTWWKWHRGWPGVEDPCDAICGLLFNVMGYLHESIKKNEIPIRNTEVAKWFTAPLGDWLPSGEVLYHQTLPTKQPDTPNQPEPKPESALDKLKDIFQCFWSADGAPDRT